MGVSASYIKARIKIRQIDRIEEIKKMKFFFQVGCSIEYSRAEYISDDKRGVKSKDYYAETIYVNDEIVNLEREMFILKQRIEDLVMELREYRNMEDGIYK